VPDRLQVVVEFVDQRNAVRDVEADDLCIADAVEVFHQRAHAVAVRRDQQPLAGPDRRREFGMPERQHAVDRVLQTFGQRYL